MMEQEHSEDEDDDIDKSDDDEFIKGLEKQHEKSSEPVASVDMGKLTRRQRMALLSKQQSLGQRSQFSAMENGNEGEIDDYSEGLPIKTSKRLPKTQISQAQQDDNKRRELTRILEEQHKKMQDRQDKLKAGGTNDQKGIGGVLGRYVTHNTKQNIQRPGMEQFAICIKLRYKDDGALGHQLCLPKGVMLPECLQQRRANSQVHEKNAKKQKDKSTCNQCGKQGLGDPLDERSLPKYKCKKTGLISCSLDCYKKNLVKK